MVIGLFALLLLFAGGALGVHALSKRLAGRSTESRAVARPTDSAAPRAAIPDPGASIGRGSTSVSCDTARRPAAPAKPPVFPAPPPTGIDPARHYTAPAGTGAGGPGYAFPDELNPSGRYTIGTVAMANAGPDTNGSQFFIVVGPDAVTLKPNYTIFGAVTQGIEVAQAFERFRPTGDGPPTVPLYMFKIDIAEGP